MADSDCRLDKTQKKAAYAAFFINLAPAAGLEPATQ